MLVTDVYIVYNDDNVINQIGGTYTLKVSPIFHFINYRSKNGKKEAWKLMNHWAAKEIPFAIAMCNSDVVKVFYSEADDNIIKSLIKFLNEQ